MNMWVRVMRGLVMIGLLLAVSVVDWTASSASAAPREQAAPTVIVVVGNRRVEAETIRSYFKLGPGERLDAAKINAGLKALYASGLFEDVRITTEGGRLVVTVVEAPVIDRIVFEGNHRLKDEQLLQEIQSKPRGTLSRPAVQADTQRIIEVYQRNGRFDVGVVPQIVQRPNNRVDLIFTVNEGEKTGIKQIVFVGNKAYTSWRLKEVIKTAESNFLSFLQTTDVYDADRIEADRDLVRRFYLKHGYADVQVVSATGEYDPSKKGFIVTFTIEEGPQYRFGAVDIQSNVRAVDPATLRPVMLSKAGDTYNGEAVEKTVEGLTIEMARRGYPFGTVRPRGDRNPETRRVGIVYVVDEGTRAYIERINIRGNTRTRDYVIRRELDVGEGDPYNRALVDRAERRIKNLNFFKSVKITNEPGSAPDRVIINIDVVEQSTGDFSIMGGYSTAQGWLLETSVSERNLLGTGRFAKVSVTYGQYVRAAELSYVEPYFLDERLALGTSLFAKQTLANSYFSYGTKLYGGSLKLGVPLREDLTLQLRYSLYTQTIQLPAYLNDCNNINPNFVNTFPTLASTTTAGSPYFGQTSCLTYGQASLPVRVELANGTTLTSLGGYGLIYSTVDNNKAPTSGISLNVGQDFAGLGGDVRYMRTVGEFRSYYEIFPDLVSVLHLQAGNMLGLGSDQIRMLDDFKMGPNLVRGFAPAGIGPRDVTNYPYGYGIGDALGGTNYWGASFEVQYPLYFLPKDAGFIGAAFIDAGSVWGYKGETSNAATGEINGLISTPMGVNYVCAPPLPPGAKGGGCSLLYTDDTAVRASAGLSLIWNSPFGPLRFDFAYPFLRQWYDRTQYFSFGGGTHF